MDSAHFPMILSKANHLLLPHQEFLQQELILAGRIRWDTTLVLSLYHLQCQWWKWMDSQDGVSQVFDNWMKARSIYHSTFILIVGTMKPFHVKVMTINAMYDSCVTGKGSHCWR